ncbi:MAG: DEAD/DEAH box helicase [Planctomycetota bacterium]|nr:DEAD/DEAH box helicase [Planctomycetota bacterium]
MALPADLAESLKRSFGEGTAAGLLHLAGIRNDAILPPAFSFWRRFGERYVTALCHIPEPEENLNLPVPAPGEELEEMAGAAPPMRGGEYLRGQTLERLWTELDSYCRKRIAECKGGLSEWLRNLNPLWHRVGRVCFHLAENRRDPEYPFAFLATYAPRLLDGRRVQYRPLGRALEEYAAAKDRNALKKLLVPVQRAAERCSWVRDLADSGEIFHPLRWTAGEAYRFLKDALLLEESGLLVRTPDWWAKRPPRVKVAVTIGEKKRSRLDAESLIDFRLDLALDGEPLSKEEIRKLLSGCDGLVFLKGRWVEVDRGKLDEVLAYWKKIEKEIGDDGLSLLQGLRLLADMPADFRKEDPAEAWRREWFETRTGKWLEERLRGLREPESLEITLPEKELRACLRPYQVTGVKWLRFLSKIGFGACLADDMGLGKTIQIIALLLLMKKDAKEGGRAGALIVMPSSLLANWKAEFDRFAPSLVYRLAHPSQTGSEELKKAAADPEAFVTGADAVLTSYGMLPRLEWLASVGWRLVVLDEAQAIKNPDTIQARAAKRLKAGARIALTGTPIENRLTDLWSIFDFLCPGLLGSQREFGELLNRLQDRGDRQYAPLRRLVGPYILRRMKTDKSIVPDLPEKIEMQAFCRLTPKQAALYAQTVRELEDSLEGKDGMDRRGTILAFILRLKQICNHPAQWLASGDYVPEDSGKFARLREICEEIASRQEKALIFTQFREVTDPLAGFLKDVFGRPGLVMHGEVPAGARGRLVAEFQREDGPPFFVLSLKVGGAGLNLTEASHVIHFDRWWNPAVENQATDRAFRIGQKKNVMVHKFVCLGTVEEKIEAMIRDKKNMAGEILDGGVPKLITEMSDRELLDLVRLDTSKTGEE